MKETLLKYVKNKYVLVVFGTFIYLLFLEETDLFTLADYGSKVTELEDQRTYLHNEIDKTRISIKSLTTDEAALERFAREQHYMKRENEDVFVFLGE